MNTNIDAYKLFQFLQKITGCDIEKKLENPPERRSGTIGTLITEDDLFKVYKEILAGNNDVAYIKGVSLLKELLENFRVRSFNPEDIRESGKILVCSSHYIEEYNEWYKKDREEFTKELFSIPLILDEEKTEANASTVSRLTKSKCRETILHTKYINLYQYRKGNAHLWDEIYEYEISNTFLITSDVNSVLSSIQPKEDNKIHFYLICKIEDRIDFTYFIIVIQYKDNVWLATDSLVFDNPRMKNTSRSAARRREDHWDNVYLPYRVIDDIEKWRKESNMLLDPNKQVEETYTKELSTYLDFGSKCCLWFMMSAVIEKLISEFRTLKQIGFVNEHIQKLLEAPKTETHTTFNDTNYDACQKYQNDFIYPKETAIVPVEKTKLLEKYVEKNWLATADNFANLVEWSEKEDIRSQKQKILSDYYNSHDEHGKMIPVRDGEILKELLEKNITKLEEFLFSGDKVYVHINDEDTTHNFGILSKHTYIPQVVNHKPNSDECRGWPMIALYNGTCNNSICYHCGEHRSSVFLHFAAHHFAELLLMTGIHDRRELPRLFWNYKTFQFIPYYGNSILDNVNPEFLVKDPLSERHPNQYTMSIHYDKLCHKKLLKKYHKYEETVYVISKNGEVLDVCEYNTYKKQFDKVMTQLL